MEMTREKVKDWLSKTEKGGLFGSNIVSDLCTALLEEMDKPKIWDGAPSEARSAQVSYWDGFFVTSDKIIQRSQLYERETRITKAWKQAEEIYKKSPLECIEFIANKIINN